VSTFVLDIFSMFFDPDLKGMTSFSYVAFTTGKLCFVNSFKFLMVRFIFNRFHFLIDSLWGFKGGLNLFLSQDIGNIITYSLDIRKVGCSTMGLVVRWFRSIDFSI
jgi:hypothetical protein